MIPPVLLPAFKAGAMSIPDSQRAAIKAAVLESLSEGGTSLRAAAVAAGTTHTTIYRWAEADPEFQEAIDSARNAAIGKAESELYDRAFDREDPKSITALIMWGKNFANWTDRQQIQHAGAVELRTDFLSGLVELGQPSIPPDAN
jgi:hypothetical protein